MMTIKQTIVAALCAAAPMAWAQLAPPPSEADLNARGAVRIAGDALATALNNQTLYHTNLATGQTIPIYFRDDGQRFLKLGSGVRSTKWWIKDDQRCEDSVAGRSSVCQKLYQDGDVLRICSVGEPVCNWVVEVTPGDAEGIAK